MTMFDVFYAKGWSHALLFTFMLMHSLLGYSEAEKLTQERVEVMANACIGCHVSTVSNSKSPSIPSLSDQTAQILETKLLAYRRGQLHNTLMTRIAKGYTEPQLKALAQFFGQ